MGLLRFTLWLTIRLPLGIALWTAGAICMATIILSPVGAALMANSYGLMRY